MKTSKMNLALGVAGAAIAMGQAYPAMATCTTSSSGTTVTCTADDNTDVVNTTTALLPTAGNLTLAVNSGVEIVQGTVTADVMPTQLGAVAVNNNGSLGIATTGPVGVIYTGDATSAANTFNLNNTGLITGGVSISQTGGAAGVTTSGVIVGPISIDNQTNSGPVSDGGHTVNGVTTTIITTTVGGADGSVTVDAGGSAGAISVAAGNSATATVAGSADSMSLDAAAGTRVETLTDDGAGTTTDHVVFTATGGDALATIAATGSVANDVTVSGLTSATVVNGGSVGGDVSANSLTALASGATSVDDVTHSVTGTGATAVATDTSTTTTVGIFGIGGVILGGDALVQNLADATIDGAVSSTGLTSAGFENAGTVSGDVNVSSTTTQGSLTVSNSTSTQVSTGNLLDHHLDYHYAIETQGGDASLSNAASGLIGTGSGSSVTVDGLASATLDNSGTIDAVTTVNATGGASNFIVDTGHTTNTYTSAGVLATHETGSGIAISDVSTGGDASLNNAAGGLIGASQSDPVNVSVIANGDASFTNSGRVNSDLVAVTAQGHAAYQNSADTHTTTFGTSTTDVFHHVGSSSTAYTGGTASFTNNQGGLIVGDSVVVAGDSGVNIVNAGIVTGTTNATSRRSGAENSSTDNTTTTVTAADGSYVTDVNNVSSETTASTGGDVTGTYSGTNGSVQFAPLYGSDGSVTQTAAGNSSATVSGTIYGDFTGTAQSSTVTTDTLHTSHLEKDAGGNTLANSFSDSSTATSQRTGGNSSLAVNGGHISNQNGYYYDGNATLVADGNASAQVGNGGVIDGNLSVTSDHSRFGGSDYVANTLHTYDEVYTGTTPTFAGYTDVNSSDTTYTNGTGKASVAIGQGTVGSVDVTGAAGGAQFDLAANGTVKGGVSVGATGSDAFESSSTTTTATVGTSGTSTVTDTTDVRSWTDNGGAVSATVAGKIGTTGGYLDVYSNGGDASLTLTGQVLGNVSVEAAGTTSERTVTTHVAADGSTTTNRTRTRSDIGGTASLTVNAASLSVPAITGYDIYVAGVAGSTATIGANSLVLSDGGYLQVGDSYSSRTSDSTYTDPAVGLSSSTRTRTRTAIGGAASLTNAGVIGDGSDFSAFVNVTSIGGATATNSGKIYGDLSATSLDENRTSTFTSVNIGDATQQDTTDRTYTAVGGAASVTNSGLVTGEVSLAGATGTLANTGVIRSDVNLGQSVRNYSTTQIDTLVLNGPETLVTNGTPFVQSYTVNQGGLVGGTVYVNGAFGPLSATDGSPVQTSAITATVNLNNGSFTAGGVAAEYDNVTGQRFTTTNVNLNGGGYLGLNAAGATAAHAAFPDAGYLSTDGARVTGVENLTKTGTGVFTIVGKDFVPATPTAPNAQYTLDLGQFAINGGEVQLDTADGGQFGIRGDLTNSATLVLGTRVNLIPSLFGSNLTSVGTQAIDGVNVYEKGNFTQTGTGNLVVGMMPALVRVYDPSINGTAVSNEPLGVQTVLYSQGLFTTPAKAFGAAFTELSPSFVTVDGNLNLAGKVTVLTPRGGLFLNGQSMDLFSVSGTVTKSATVDAGTNNNFVTFNLGTRTVSGRQIVSVAATRVGYETAATNTNAAAAGAALSAALPGVVAALQADAAGTGPFTSVSQLQLTQDLATVMAGLDTQLTAAQAAQALNELGGGSYYGSLTTVKTTAPFVDALSTRRLPEGAHGFTMWLEPNGEFVRTDANSTTGAARLRADNYGVSGGLGVATGTGEFGLGFGYGRIQTHSGDNLAQAKANTYMVGLFGRQDLGPISVAADLVYGWSNWDASRSLPTLSRAASATFDSKELRGDLRVEYRVPLGAAWVAPYGQLELRHFKFDGFNEQGAGAVGLSVKEASHTILTPTLGAKVGSTMDTGFGRIRPEAAVSYTFNVNEDSFRDVAFEGAPGQGFRLQGVDPKGFAKFQLGLNADIGSHAGAFVRGSYATGGGYDNASIRAGIVIGF